MNEDALKFEEIVTPPEDTPGVILSKTFVRSIALPVQECASAPWLDFCRVMDGCWRQSTDLANWASHQLRLADVSRTPGMTCLPPLAPVDLYALAFGRAKEGRGRLRHKCPSCPATFLAHLCVGGVPPHRHDRAACGGSGLPGEPQERERLPVTPPLYDGGDFWRGGKIQAATVLQKVDRDYRKDRAKVVWLRHRRTREYTFPYPLPVHRQSWVAWMDGGRPYVSISLPGGRVTLRLRNGPEMANKIKILKAIIDGETPHQELMLTAQRTLGCCGSPVYRRRSNGVNEKYIVMVRIAYTQEAFVSQEDGICELKTGKEPFLELVVPGKDRWLLFAPHVLGWIAAHRRFLEQFAYDLKHEKRWPAKKRNRMNRRRDRACNKYANTMKTFHQQTACQVVGWLKRQKCGKLVYDDKDKSFAESYPWATLKAAIKAKCEENGVAFRDASGGNMKTKESPDSDGKEGSD